MVSCGRGGSGVSDAQPFAEEIRNSKDLKFMIDFFMKIAYNKNEQRNLFDLSALLL